MSLQIEFEEEGNQSSTRDFHHPFQPYDIQYDFMNALYECIENKQVGIFESPTGTGKSLSLICGALTWLRHQQDLGIADDAELSSKDEPRWVIEHAREERRRAFISNKQEIERHLATIRAKEKRQRQRYENGERPQKRMKTEDGTKKPVDEEGDVQFLLADYDSDEEASGKKRGDSEQNDGLSAASLDLMSKLGMIPMASEDEGLGLTDGIKIFYCSRTHSQLIQFAHEVRRVKIPLNLESEDPELKTNPIEEIKHLSLGSRQNLCINPKVRKLEGSTAINERCLELQQSKTKDQARCSFLPNKENEPLLHSFRDHTLAKVRDIEELASLGKKIGICPYYASRATVKPSEIVTLPYPLMLQKSAREALDLSLKDHVVIIDEAHNLMDAISSIHSSTVTLAQLQRARAQLGVYLQKFRNKLKGKNRVYVTQVVRTIDSLLACLNARLTQSKPFEGVATVTDLMAGKGADQINLYKLSHYLQESKLARKVDGYIACTEEANRQKQNGHSSMPVLTHVESFFRTLTNPTAEGRFFYTKTEEGNPSLKYQLLDPVHHFKDVVDEARSVILAGGTMSPTDDYIKHLLPYLPASKIRILSCGHVIPESNLLAWPVSRAPGDALLDFTFEKRSLPSTMDALGASILSLARTIPDGLVVFFPSYSYLEQVTARWGSSANKLWDSLVATKPVFLESKEKGGGVEDVLQQYSSAITTGNGRGALLLSVVGGKMSEGINFSDALGRGVVIVGLPFPSIQSPEWKAKMEYIEAREVAGGGTVGDGKAAARNFYENACMRAVNQSIGRAIRHMGDYASIVMLDRRYATGRIQEKLPGWIKRGLVKNADGKSFDEVVGSIGAFFAKDRSAG